MGGFSEMSLEAARMLHEDNNCWIFLLLYLPHPALCQACWAFSHLLLLLHDCTHSTKGLANKFYLRVSCREPDLRQNIIIAVSMISQGKYDLKIKSEVTELIRSLSEIRNWAKFCRIFAWYIPAISRIMGSICGCYGLNSVTPKGMLKF